MEVEVGGIGISCLENGGVKRDDDDFVCYVYICFSILFWFFFRFLYIDVTLMW